MLPRPCGTFFSSIPRVIWLAAILLFLVPTDLLAATDRSNVLCRDDLSSDQAEKLAGRLRKITGNPTVRFDAEGFLRVGNEAHVGGSESARALITNSVYGHNVVVIEDASNSSEVAFCRVIPGKWKNSVAGSPPAFVVQIDFVDFERVVGDQRALEAFNVGWGLLHELDHIANDTADANALGEAGECEANINQMRRELNLPERTDYFYTQLPLNTDSAFMTRLVRLAFEQQQPRAKKKKRYWVVWDANVVGGLEQNQIAALR